MQHAVYVRLLLACIALTQVILCVYAEDHRIYDDAVNSMGAGAIREEMEHLIESIGHVAADSHHSHEKSDVVDLGASLRMMEDKFAALRNALLTDMGVAIASASTSKDGDVTSPHAEEEMRTHAKQLVTKGSDMISVLAKSRQDVSSIVRDIKHLSEELKQLRDDLKDVDSSVKAIGASLSNAHIDQGVLQGAHAEIRDSLHSVRLKSYTISSTQEQYSGYVPKWYYVVFAEVVILAGYAAYKHFVSRGPRGLKYSKLG